MEKQSALLEKRPPTIYTESIEEREANVRYCLYARKSTESDELQALSIDSQINEMTELAKKEGLNIVEVRKESHSAKNSGTRPVYNSILEDIRAGAFNGILTWAPDRLSRNAGDLGTLVDLMDRELLVKIRTNGQIFTNNPNEKFLLMILCSQAKLENDNKRVNVKRGLKAKCELGIRPGSAPLGYLNEKSNIRGKSRIFLDPERAPIVKKMFEKVAYEYCSGRDLYRWLAYDIDFKMRSGKRITLGGIYRVLDTPFYYGEFEYPEGSGNWYQGTHEPIIDKDLYTKVRNNMTIDPRLKYGSKEFQFTRLIKCGHCGWGITAEEKFKKLADGSVKRYVYYHCVRKIDKDCQEPYVTEEELLEQLIDLMDKIDFHKKGCFEKLKQEVDKFNTFSSMVFKKENPELKHNGVDLKSYAKYVLQEGTKEEKRELLSNLKTELILKDKKIIIAEPEIVNNEKKKR